MKRLLVVIVVAALGWAGYWFWGAQNLKSGFSEWFEDRRDEGWQAEYSDMSLRGFPNRHDTTWTDLKIVDPDTGLGWHAPFFQLLLLSYNQHHAIAIWPDQQQILTPDGNFDLVSESLQASVVTSGTKHALERANLVADVLNVSGPEGDTTAMAQLRAALSRLEGENAYDIALSIDGLALSTPFLRAAGNALPETFQEARLQAEIRFEAPLSLGTLEDPQPRPTYVDLSLARLQWGPMALKLTGEADIDRKGRLEGELNLRAENWRDMLRVAKSSGEVPASVVDGLEAGLSLLAQFSGNGKTLDVKLRFENNQTYLGPLPIGPAPRIELR